MFDALGVLLYTSQELRNVFSIPIPDLQRANIVV
jgi:hypothetical protein